MPPPKYDISEVELKHKKALFLEKEIVKYHNINTFLLILYYTITLIAIYFMFSAYNFTMYLKIPTVLFLLILPFFMYTIEEFVVDNIVFSKNLILGNPHKKKD